MPLRSLRDAVASDAKEGARFFRSIPRPDSLARETASQAVKSGLAAVAAWLVAAHLFSLPLPYLAPWVALVMVRNTVYWSVLSGVRQVTAVCIGLGLAYLGGVTLPGTELALVIVVPIAVLLGQWPRLGDQGLYVTFTALFLVTLGEIDDADIVSRLMETGIGVVVGTAVNLLVFPPLRVRSVRETCSRSGQEAVRLLRDVAEGLSGELDPADTRDWAHRAERLDGRVSESVQELRRGHESLLLNPRPPRERNLEAVEDYRAAADLVSRVGASVESIAGSLGEIGKEDAPYAALPVGFRRPYAHVLDVAASKLEERLGRLGCGTPPESDAPVDIPSEVYETLEYDVEMGRAADGISIEIEGALLVAARRLLRDLAE
ncbi:aromatic acid exporter family protein [Glycomyces halotolerans]